MPTAGLDLQRVLEAVAPGAAGSWSFQPRPTDHRREFRPRVFCRALCRRHGHRPGRGPTPDLQLPGLTLASELYARLVAQGHARRGTHALIFALAEMNGIDWTER